MKIILIILVLLLCSCETRIEDQDISYAGKKKVGDGTYVEKFYIGNDRIYILVDDSNCVIGSMTSTNITVKRGKYSHVESKTVFSR